ncbi:MAG: Cna B-type domain-containing protein [Lachnospiraceae bacterium]|nr:Cna B-type domain-containing protein [Lachnospiraceae bacterium]
MWKKFQKNYRHQVAILMVLLMVMTNAGSNLGIVMAARESESALFLLDGEELREAIQKTEQEKELFVYDSLQLEAEKNSVKKRYEKLLGKKNGSVYELDLNIDDSYAPEEAELRSFYNTITKDVVFLFVNKSDMAVSYRINIDGYETEPVTVSPIVVPVHRESYLGLRLSRHGATKVFASLGAVPDNKGNSTEKETETELSAEKGSEGEEDEIKKQKDHLQESRSESEGKAEKTWSRSELASKSETGSTNMEGQLLEDGDIWRQGRLKGKGYDTVKLQDDGYAKAVKVGWKDIKAILDRQATEYAVAYSVNLPEAASTEGAGCVAEGEDLYFAVEPKNGYEVNCVAVNGQGTERMVRDINGASDSNWGHYQHVYVVRNVSEDLEIAIEVKHQEEMDRQGWTAASNLKELHTAFNNQEEKIYLTDSIETAWDPEKPDDGDYGWAIKAGTDIIFDLNGHTLTYGGEGSGYFRLFYIRGNLTLMDSAGGGKITSSREEIDSAICVDGGRLTIESGQIGTVQGPGDVKTYQTGHGVVVKGQGTVCMKGGCIAGNGNGMENGGGIYVESGVLEVCDGSIEHNTANNGGGIYGTESSVIHITGGTISNNVSTGGGDRLSGYDFGGGGIFARGELILTDGTVKENTAVSGGGGIYYDTIDFDENKNFVMTGGVIDNNMAEKGEGGGIYFGWHGTVTGGRITENHTNTKIDWGGGGIFTQTGVEVTIFNALITENTADGFGGGVAGCPSGNIYALTIDGAGIFDNMAKGTALTEREEEDGRTEDQRAKADTMFMTAGFGDYYCEKISTVFGNMLGGGNAEWHGSSDGSPVIINKNNFARAEKRMGLNACPSPEDKIRAREYAHVLISGNTSSTHGGGIMSNGTLILGSDIEMINVSGSKIWKGDQKEDRPASIIINLLANGALCASKEITGEEDKWGWSFDEIPKTGEDGNVISYTVEEVPVFGYETEIKESGNGFSIINTYVPEKTSRTVRKIWSDSDNQKGRRPVSIHVQLMADGMAEGNAVMLSEENQWSYTWENLLQKSGDKDINYTVVELETLEGYATTYSEDTFTITNTLVNPGKPGSGSRPGGGGGRFVNIETSGGPGSKDISGIPGRITATPMEGADMPLAELLSGMTEEQIEDPDRPLAALAKTGDNRPTGMLLIIFGTAGVGILLLAGVGKREKEV